METKRLEDLSNINFDEELEDYEDKSKFKNQDYKNQNSKIHNSITQNSITQNSITQNSITQNRLKADNSKIKIQNSLQPFFTFKHPSSTLNSL